MDIHVTYENVAEWMFSFADSTLAGGRRFAFVLVTTGSHSSQLVEEQAGSSSLLLHRYCPPPPLLPRGSCYHSHSQKTME